MREPRHIATTTTGGAAPSRAISFPSPLRMIWSVLRGLVEGALPILILVGTGALFWEVLTIVRLVTAQYGFGVTQFTENIVSILAVGVALLVFVVAGLRTLRGVRDRHLEGDYIESSVAMLVLLVSVLYVLAQFMGISGAPQHPAP
ncbi:MAG TPA: hypothetical protein VF808_07210 [Ktedonobacterales bacterium]